MARIARILVADKNLEIVNLISARLRARDFVNMLEMSGADALGRARSERPDVVVLGTGLDDASCLEIACGIRADPSIARTPILVVDSTKDSSALTQELAAQIDGYIVAPFSDDELYAHIYAALRLEVMQYELRNRAVTMLHYGIEDFGAAVRSSEDALSRVLIVGQDGLSPLQAALSPTLEIETMHDRTAAGDRLGEGGHEAAIVSAGDDLEAALTCCEDIRRVPTLYHLPVLLVTSGDIAEDRGAPFRRGATATIAAPFEPDQLRARIAIMVKQEQLRRRILKACREGGGAKTNDPLTGVFSEEFLHKHLELLVQNAFRWDRSLSLTVIYLPEVTRVRNEYGDEAGDALFCQLGDMISRLVRGEDLCTRLGETGFCVVMPESTLEGTGVIMHRLSGVVRNSVFSLPNTNRRAKVQPRLASAEYKPGDTPAALLGRALVAAAGDAVA
jgi:two-component system cell cycle response regulator